MRCRIVIVRCCEQSLRRYNLKANHNPERYFQTSSVVVSNHYEDTIWKQITTCIVRLSGDCRLWAIITKIQSESKSQQKQTSRRTGIRCEQSLRRYNLKANHNIWFEVPCWFVVVSNHYEDTIWKQITTFLRHLQNVNQLWAIITKIQSESKSQPLVVSDWIELGCEQSLRRYNLKANHNLPQIVALVCMLWAIITKIQSESKSQHIKQHIAVRFSCEQSLRRYNLKANHNDLELMTSAVKVVSNHYEDTIWKQITTVYPWMLPSDRLWAIITKIQSESKSQPLMYTNLVPTCCEQSLRRYNLKANHNGGIFFNAENQLWAIITKIQSESKSQRSSLPSVRLKRCEQSLRRYNLKANHNGRSHHTSDVTLWAIITKIQSESKSQLSTRTSEPVHRCEQSLRRYNLKANHNWLFGKQTLNQLWAIITKIQSESKSQRLFKSLLVRDSCEQSLRRYNLKVQ